MCNSRKNHGGAFLRSHSKHNALLKFILLGLVIVMVCVLAFTQFANAEAKSIYHLPDEVPSFSLPDNLPDNFGSHSIDDLVVPHYSFQLVAGDHTTDVSLPVIKARFGNDFNIEITERLNTLIGNILFYLNQNESYIVNSVSYEAYIGQEMLTILLWTDYNGGQIRCEPWFFDLSEGKQITDTWKQAEALLGMEYSTFLWVTDRYIQSSFAETYYEHVYTDPEDQMDDEQLAFLDNYRCILKEIPCDISSAFSRWVFPGDGKVYMLYELPLVCNDWYSGFRTEAKLVEIDASILRYKDMITPAAAMKEAILNNTVHVMGGTDQACALLVRRLFHSSPELFISAVAEAHELDREYAVDCLLRHVSDDELSSIQMLCSNLESSAQLTKEESEVVTQIISEIAHQFR